MKLLIAALLIALCFVPVLAQDPPKPEPAAIELMALYKQAGRAWSYRIINSVRGESPAVATVSARVTSYKDGRAQCSTETRSADGFSSSSRHETILVSKVPDAAAAWVATEVPVVRLATELGTFECKKHVNKQNTRQITTWVSTRFHPLIVKQVTLEGELTVITKLDSFEERPVDPWQLYRKEGRRWKTKMTLTGGMISFNEFKVKQVKESSATYDLTSFDAKGTQVFSQPAERPFTESAVEPVRSAPPTHRLRQCAAGEFLCVYTDAGGVKTWSSVHWPGLLVAMEAKAVTVELIEFDTGHDPHAFYRTAGNYCRFKQTVTLNGKSSEKVWREEVKSGKDREVVWSYVTYDAAGKESGRIDETLTLPEKPQAMRWAGEYEEVVETPAGRVAALRTRDDRGEAWTWNGVTVRSQSEIEGSSVVIELTEKNWQ